MLQPVRDMLRGNPERRPVLHQPHVVDVRHLRAADSLVDPAHDIAENALAIVVELFAHLVVGPVAALRQRRGQQVGQAPRHRVGEQLILPRHDVDLMIVQRV